MPFLFGIIPSSSGADFRIAALCADRKVWQFGSEWLYLHVKNVKNSGSMGVNTVLSLLTVVLMTSCGEAGGGARVHYDDSKAKGFLESECVARITVVPLETSEECMVSSRSGVICHNGDYIVYGIDAPVRRFDSEGRFLNDVGGLGDASDRYRCDESVRVLGDTVRIRDTADGLCRHYTLGGEFVCSHECTHDSEVLSEITAGDVSYKLYFYDHDNGYRLAEMVGDSVVRTFLPVRTRDLNIGLADMELMCESGGEIWFTELLSDEITGVSDGKLKILYEFDMGRYAAPKNAEAMRMDEFEAVLRKGGMAMNVKLHAMERYVILVRTVADENNTVIYMLLDSASGEWSFVKTGAGEMFGGMPYFDDNGGIVFISPADKVLGHVGLPFSDAIKGLDENSNSVIIRVELR